MDKQNLYIRAENNTVDRLYNSYLNDCRGGEALMTKDDFYRMFIKRGDADKFQSVFDAKFTEHVRKLNTPLQIGEQLSLPYDTIEAILHDNYI